MSDQPTPDPLYIPARLSAGEAADHRSRLLGLMGQAGPLTIEFSEGEGCNFPTAVALQLGLAAAAQLTAAGSPPTWGPEAQRLLAQQKLL